MGRDPDLLVEPSETAETFEAGDARVTIDPADGCRLTSLRIADHELLRTQGDPPWGYGCFVMAPWAGRIRGGQARFAGRSLDFTTADDGHALHGLVHSAPWEKVADDRWQVQVDESQWIGALRIRQRVRLEPDALHLDLEVVTATSEPVPATVGWHPWFPRHLGDAAVEVGLPAAWMLRRAPDGIATDQRVPVPDGPWDDAFGSLDGPVTLTWPDRLRLSIDSDASVTVVYTEPEQWVCVEPQSGPPDEVNQAPRLVFPGDTLRLSTTWRWELLA